MHMYVCVCICMYAYVYVCMRMYMYVCESYEGSFTTEYFTSICEYEAEILSEGLCLYEYIYERPTFDES